MAKLIRADASFDEMEDEILFTRAAVGADPDASDLLPLTDSWLKLVDGARAKDRAAREAVANANAQRGVANGRLDDSCQAFADDLHLAVQKDHKSTRWTRFFGPGSVTQFIRQRLTLQVDQVRSWMPVTGDAILDKHRPSLEKWSAMSRTALEATALTGQIRGDAHVARETVAEDLTRERDGLELKLRDRAQERKLPRDWHKRFFRTRAASTGEGEQDDPGQSAVG